MNLLVNGANRELEAETLLDVIRHFGLEGKPVVAEVDGDIVASEQWSSFRVVPNMRIELVHFVGGG